MKTGWMLMALLVAGCATSEGYQKNISAWIGRPKAELIAAWGPPNSDSTIPPTSGSARKSCRETGVGWFMDVEAAVEALNRCADRMIADWNWGWV